MIERLTHEDVMELRRLFWRFSRGEITLLEMQQRVNEIAGKQLTLSAEEQKRNRAEVRTPEMACT